MFLRSSLVAFALFATSAIAADPVVVVLKTDKGDIEIELDEAKAPNTVANFLKYVDAKHYNGGRFHRTVTPDNQPDKKVKIEVIQGGVAPDKEKVAFPAFSSTPVGPRQISARAPKPHRVGRPGSLFGEI